MKEKETDSNSSANILNLCGTDYNYSIDYLKRAAFIDEINNVLSVKNLVDLKPVLDYLNNRVDEISKKYK